MKKMQSANVNAVEQGRPGHKAPEALKPEEAASTSKSDGSLLRPLQSWLCSGARRAGESFHHYSFGIQSLRWFESARVWVMWRRVVGF